jgi:hypothetical protein
MLSKNMLSNKKLVYFNLNYTILYYIIIHMFNNDDIIIIIKNKV